MKKPDEIKKGLECCMEDKCFGERDNCPYTGDPTLYVGMMCEDALAYIKQLEAERDAALADFKLYRERNIKGECGVYACDLCKRGGRYEDWDEIKCPTGCMGVSHWEWRGVQKEG
jgi:hypothetical protein